MQSIGNDMAGLDGVGPRPSSPRLVVIAASAGGLPAILEVLAPLPADFPAAVAIVQHRGPDNAEQLLHILARSTRLRICHAYDGASLEPGTVYVCPPSVHMTTEHCTRLSVGPRIDYVQPNANLMFESVARTYGGRALGVVLSGAGADAAVGSLAMAHAGAVVLAQEESTCRFPEMPRAAVQTGGAERKLRPAEIARALRDWAQEPAGAAAAAPTPQEKTRTVSVLLVDDHRIILDGLRVLLESQPDMQVVGAAEDGASALVLAERAAPDVVVMDLRLPGLSGVETTERLLACLPSAKVLALSAESDARSVNAIFRAGATGYLTKHRAFGELVQAIRAVMLGRTYLSPEAARLVAQGIVSPPTPRSA